MQQGVFGMTAAQWLTGCAVILATVVCGAASARWAERTFVRPPESAAADSTTHTRTCVTLSGKRFEWNYPNPPFGTLSCSE
jgi:hypothetical protein